MASVGGFSPETRSARLLIVEDDPLLVSSLEELLSDSGFEVVGTAASAATALSLAEERRPELALILLVRFSRSRNEGTRPSSTAAWVLAQTVPRKPSF